MNIREELKRRAADAAVEQIRDGMVLGLGSGSTVAHALQRLAELLQAGKIDNVCGVPSSIQTEKQARQLGIPLTSLDRHPILDLTIDGADEVDPELNLIKGGGGALLREKILTQASRRTVFIVDQSKLSPRLGSHWPLPVEVIDFAVKSIENYLTSIGASVELRRTAKGNPFRTDQNNVILDANFGPIENPRMLATKLADRAGIVAHGLFLNMADEVIVAEENAVRHLRR
ncbi:MAG: ribose-5-phosphate isomerase RpiA [Desulfobacterales bacterium]|jgi:ribose 5-phosphate isomerase A